MGERRGENESRGLFLEPDQPGMFSFEAGLFFLV